MTQNEYDTLRKVAPAIESLINDCLSEAPAMDLKKILDGVHTDSMIAHHASIEVGFIEFAKKIQKKLRLPSKKTSPKIRGIVHNVKDIPGRNE
jgi:hypothetical protein